MGKTVYCEECSGIINSRNDLVTANLIFDVAPYHEDCYARGLKGMKTLILSNKPINGFAGNFSTFMFILLGLGLVIFADGSAKYASIVTLFPIGYRVFSYLTYERHLKK